MFRATLNKLKSVLQPVILVYVGFAFSLIANATMFKTNRTLADGFERYRSHFELKPGFQLPPLNGKGIDGKPLQVAFDGQNDYTLLLVFSPHCAYCDKNWPTWSRLLSQLDRTSVRPIAIDMSGSADAKYIRTHSINEITLFTAIDYGTRAAYNLYAVPMTMVLSTDGTVEQLRIGQLTAMDLKGLEALLTQR